MNKSSIKIKGSNTARSLQLVVFGVPISIKKKEFKKVSAKLSRKSKIAVIDKVNI
jgi:hypothetical protein